MGGRTVEGEHISPRKIDYNLDLGNLRTEAAEAIIANEVAEREMLFKLVLLIMSKGREFEEKFLSGGGSDDFWNAFKQSGGNYLEAAKNLGLEVDEE